MKKGSIIFLLLFFMWQVRSQDDVLLQLQETEKMLSSGTLSNEEMFRKYNDLMWGYYTIDTEKTHYYFKEAVAFAQENKNPEWQARYFRRMGVVHFYLGEKEAAFSYLDTALVFIQGKAYYLEECMNYEERGNFHRNLNEHEKALSNYQKAIEWNKKDKAAKIAGKEDIEGNIQKEVSIIINISGVYGILLNFEKSSEYLYRALQIIEENPAIDLERYEYKITGFLAENYLQTNQLEKSFAMATKFYEMAKARTDLGSMVFGLKHLSNYNRQQGNLKQALIYAKESLQLAEQTKQPYLLGIAYGNLVKTYLYMKEYQSALHYVEKNLAMTEEDDWLALEDIYADLVLIYALMGEQKTAENYQSKYRDITAKISDENLHNALQEMEVKYEVQQKEQEILTQQTEIKRHKTWQYIYLCGLLATGLLVALLIYIVILRNKRNRELAEMNATKDKFFSIISHDLKNPVIAQRNALQSLIDHAGEMDIQSLQHYYIELLKSSDSQIELLYNLLNWAQLQTGRMPFCPNPFDLCNVAENEINLLQTQLSGKTILLNTQFPENAIAYGDRIMIAVVIRNILTNAIKFTPEGGKIHMEIIDQKTDFTVSITDNGIGMDEKTLHNLFMLDGQTSRTGTAGETGNGLGLIVSKELIEKNGGKLNVESAEGKGSCFSFTVKRYQL